MRFLAASTVFVNLGCRTTVLHAAAAVGSEVLVRLLIENRADVSSLDDYRRHLAAEGGHAAVMFWLRYQPQAQ
jgi:hypothetical protein